MADTLIIHWDAIDALKTDPAVGRLLGDVAEELVVPHAQAAAPHRTGAGAASIHAEQVFDDSEWMAHIGWDRDHFYMHFSELGTVNMPARPFLVPALEGLG